MTLGAAPQQGVEEARASQYKTGRPKGGPWSCLAGVLGCGELPENVECEWVLIVFKHAPEEGEASDQQFDRVLALVVLARGYLDETVSLLKAHTLPRAQFHGLQLECLRRE